MDREGSAQASSNRGCCRSSRRYLVTGLDDRPSAGANAHKARRGPGSAALVGLLGWALLGCSAASGRFAAGSRFSCSSW